MPTYNCLNNNTRCLTNVVKSVTSKLHAIVCNNKKSKWKEYSKNNRKSSKLIMSLSYKEKTVLR